MPCDIQDGREKGYRLEKVKENRKSTVMGARKK